METRKPPAGSSGRQSCVDAWEHAKPKGKWKEVCEALKALLKKKKITWNKSGKESARREADLYTMLESAATNEKKEERERDKLGDRLEAFLERKEKEDEATCLIEEMRKNVEAAQHKSFEAEQSLSSALREYVDTFDRDRGRPKTIMTKLLQSMQSRETKNLNLEKDLEDILSKMKQMGGGEQDKAARLWKQVEVTINKRTLPGSQEAPTTVKINATYSWDKTTGILERSCGAVSRIMRLKHPRVILPGASRFARRQTKSRERMMILDWRV